MRLPLVSPTTLDCLETKPQTCGLVRKLLPPEQGTVIPLGGRELPPPTRERMCPTNQTLLLGDWDAPASPPGLQISLIHYSEM